jgi:hypothetical protein
MRNSICPWYIAWIQQAACVQIGVSMSITIQDLQLPKTGNIENIGKMEENPFIVTILELLSGLFNGMDILFKQIEAIRIGNQKIISIKEIKDTSILVKIRLFDGKGYTIELRPKDEDINTFINNIQIFSTLLSLKNFSRIRSVNQYVTRMFRVFFLLNDLKQKTFTYNYAKSKYGKLISPLTTAIYKGVDENFTHTKDGQIFSWTDKFLDLYFGKDSWPEWALETLNEQVSLKNTETIPCCPKLTEDEIVTLRYISEDGYIFHPDPKFGDLERIQLLDSFWNDGTFKEPLHSILSILYTKKLIGIQGDQDVSFEKKLHFIPDIVAFTKFVNCYGIQVNIRNPEVVKEEEETKAPEVIPEPAEPTSEVPETETSTNLGDPMMIKPVEEVNVPEEEIPQEEQEIFLGNVPEEEKKKELSALELVRYDIELIHGENAHLIDEIKILQAKLADNETSLKIKLEEEKQLIIGNIANGILESFKSSGITISVDQAMEIAQQNMP